MKDKQFVDQITTSEAGVPGGPVICPTCGRKCYYTVCIADGTRMPHKSWLRPIEQREAMTVSCSGKSVLPVPRLKMILERIDKR